MNRRWVLPLAVVILAGCGIANNSLYTMSSSENNMYNLWRISKGMSEHEVIRIMHKPFDYEVFAFDDDVYDVWFYITRVTGLGQTRLVPQNLTPLIFKNGVLVDVGYTYYNFLIKEEQLRFKAASQPPAQPIEKEDKYENKELEKTLETAPSEPSPYPVQTNTSPPFNPTPVKSTSTTQPVPKKATPAKSSTTPQTQGTSPSQGTVPQNQLPGSGAPGSQLPGRASPNAPAPKNQLPGSGPQGSQPPGTPTKTAPPKNQLPGSGASGSQPPGNPAPNAPAPQNQLPGTGPQQPNPPAQPQKNNAISMCSRIKTAASQEIDDPESEEQKNPSPRAPNDDQDKMKWDSEDQRMEEEESEQNFDYW